MKSCFIIMPVTTPDALRKVYHNDSHFHHVLNNLFVPAIEAAGFEAILPVAKGADLIHARIIEHLEQADLVLCDMSALNPNVFFELGIRVALNKPISLVMDETTKRNRNIPFDIQLINHHIYRAGPEPVTISEEIHSLKKHAENSLASNPQGNLLWHFFGVSRAAVPHGANVSREDRLEYLTMQVDAIRNRMDERSPVFAQQGHVVRGDEQAWVDPSVKAERAIRRLLEKFASSSDIQARVHVIDGTDHFIIETSTYNDLTDDQKSELLKKGAELFPGWTIKVEPISEQIE